MQATAWDFGWEALVAIGTVLLALATAWLALATRRMVRYTAQEVQATRRPTLLPVKDVAVQATLLHDERGVPPYRLLLPLKNAGVGPALNLIGAIAERQPFRLAEYVAVGDEYVVDVPVFVYPDGDKTLEGYTTPLHIDYTDIGGVPFTTSLSLHLGTAPPSTLSVFVTKVAQGAFTSPLHFQRPMTMHMWRRTPLRAKMRRAGHSLFLAPGEPMRPLRPRIGDAWREIFPPKQQSYLQRIRLARRATPDGHPWFSNAYENAKGGRFMRWVRRMWIRAAVKVNTFQKRRYGF